MPVRRAVINNGRAGDVAGTVRAWKAYYCNGTLGQLLVPAPAQQCLSFVVDGRTVSFGPSPFTYDGVTLLFNRGPGSLTVGFFDEKHNDGKGGILPAVAPLTADERTRLGSSWRRTRERFLTSLIAAARQQAD